MGKNRPESSLVLCKGTPLSSVPCAHTHSPLQTCEIKSWDESQDLSFCVLLGRHCRSSRGWRVAHTALFVRSHDGHFVGMLQVSRAFAFSKETLINSVHPDGYSGLLSRTLQSDAATCSRG